MKLGATVTTPATEATGMPPAGFVTGGVSETVEQSGAPDARATGSQTAQETLHRLRRRERVDAETVVRARDATVGLLLAADPRDRVAYAVPFGLGTAVSRQHDDVTSKPAAVTAMLATAVEFGSSAPNDCHAPSAWCCAAKNPSALLHRRVVPGRAAGDERLHREARGVGVGVGARLVAEEVPAAVAALRRPDRRERGRVAAPHSTFLAIVP